MRTKSARCGGGGGDDAPAAVALVALSPPDNASSNSPAVSLGLASVELNAAAEAGSSSFRGLLFPGAGDDEREALAAAVEEALGTATEQAEAALPGPLSQL